MFDKSMVRAILSRDGKVVSHLDDNSDGVITDGIYVYREEVEAVPDITPGIGRPGKMFKRSMRVETLEMFGGISWREVGIGVEFEPVARGWCDDVLIGVCRLSDDDSRMKINPTELWRMYCHDVSWLGATVKGITHRHRLSERHARRYMDKLIMLDAMLVYTLDRISQARLQAVEREEQANTLPDDVDAYMSRLECERIGL